MVRAVARRPGRSAAPGGKDLIPLSPAWRRRSPPKGARPMPDGQSDRFAMPGRTATHGERGSPCSGLPILSTTPLTSFEREALRNLDRATRVIADAFADAVTAGRVDRGLEACSKVAAIAELAGRASALLGR